MSRLNPIVRLFIELAGEEIAEEILADGLDQAITTMEGMCANEGQTSVLTSYIIPEFENNTEEAQNNEDYEFQDVTAGDFSDFMGEIVEEGNSIMQTASLYARLVEAASDALSGFDDEGLDADEADFENE